MADNSPWKEPAGMPKVIAISKQSLHDRATHEDKLNFKPYVKALADFITDDGTQGPLTISVEGEWGSGKSSFMQQLQERLKQNAQNKKSPPIVNFSPWRHDGENSMCAAFAIQFLDQIKKQSHYWHIHSWWKLFGHRFNWRSGWFDLLRFISSWLILIGTVFATIYVIWNQGTSAAVKLLQVQDAVELNVWIVKFLTRTFGSALTFLLAHGLKNKFKTFYINTVEVDLKRHMKTPNYEARVSFLENFHADFKKIIHSYISPKEKVYVFIDDLDRCAVPKAAELMQAINLMMPDDPSLIFILGMDREKVAAGIAVKDEHLLKYIYPKVDTTDVRDEGLRYGYAFIEKFIQIPFCIPTPETSDVEAMLVDTTPQSDQNMNQPPGLIERIKNFFAKSSISKHTEPVAEKNNSAPERVIRIHDSGKVNFPEIRKIVAGIASCFDIHPRRIKQFFNLYRLRLLIAEETALFEKPEDMSKNWPLTPEMLAKFVALEIWRPMFISEIRNRPNLLALAEEMAFLPAEKKDENLEEDAKRVRQDLKDDDALAAMFKWQFDWTNNKQSENFDDKKREFSRYDIEKLLKAFPAVPRPIITNRVITAEHQLPTIQADDQRGSETSETSNASSGEPLTNASTSFDSSKSPQAEPPEKTELVNLVGGATLPGLSARGDIKTVVDRPEGAELSVKGSRIDGYAGKSSDDEKEAAIPTSKNVDLTNPPQKISATGNVPIQAEEETEQDKEEETEDVPPDTEAK